MNNQPFSSFILLALTLAAAGAEVRYVNLANPSPAPPYISWANAATNIQDAIDAADAGDEIVVTNGVYATGGRQVDGFLTNRVAVTKPVTVRSLNGPEVTVIQGYQVPGTSNGFDNVRCVYLDGAASLVGFKLTNGATLFCCGPEPFVWLDARGGGVFCASASAKISNCVLSGNSALRGGGAYGGTLNNCTFSGNSANYGGGADECTLVNCTFIGNSAANVGGGAYVCMLSNCTLAGNAALFGGGAAGGTLDNCTLTGNTALAGGGASFFNNVEGPSGATLNNCTLAGNSARYGGGVYGSSLSYGGSINDCTLSTNSAEVGGGASQSTLTNCTLTGNSATSDGGGVHVSRLSHCTLIGNSAGAYGGGAYSDRFNTLTDCVLNGNSARSGGGVYFGTLYNCTVTGNSAREAGGGGAGDPSWGLGTGLHARFYNCIVYSNQAPTDANYYYSIFEYSCTMPLPPGPGNINADPGIAGGVCGFRLRAGSPCVDAGTNLSALLTTDIVGTPRPLDGDGDRIAAFDMGAYEFDLRISAQPGPLAITHAAVGADGRLHVFFAPGDSSAYYILYRGSSITHIDAPVSVNLGAACISPELIDPALVAIHGTAFYRVREVPMDHPLDSDGDGIDDVFELSHARFLNPLNSADAAQDFDHDGKSNLQEFLAGSNPTRPRGQALAANDHGLFALKTNGSLWAFDSVQGQLQRVGGNSNYVSVLPGGFPVAVGDQWGVGSTSYDGAAPHALVLTTDGSLWAWGDNSYGQLGDGTYTSHSNPTPVGTNSDWSAVAAGTLFSTGIKTDGTLWAWGDNQNGQLGNGTNDPGTNVPVQIGIDRDWLAVDNSKFDYFGAYTLALKTDGSVWSWGSNGAGQLGLGESVLSVNVPTRVGTDTDWRGFSAGNAHVSALKADGSLWTWGNSSGGGSPTRIGTATNWVAIAAGVDFSVALKTDGTLWSWSVGASPQQVGTDTDWGSPP